jgi:hypothetical protein
VRTNGRALQKVGTTIKEQESMHKDLQQFGEVLGDWLFVDVPNTLIAILNTFLLLFRLPVALFGLGSGVGTAAEAEE